MTKSKSYQHKFQEVLIEPHKFEEIFSKPLSYSTEYSDALSELMNELTPLLPTILTKTQFKYLNDYYFNNLTQQEIADKYSITQPAVIKSLQGNHSYENNTVKRYGGALKKIETYILNTPHLYSLYEQVLKARNQGETDAN